MRIKILRANLYLAVQRIAQYSKAVTTLEWLKWMRIDPIQDATHNGLMLTCTQLDITVSIYVPAVIQGKSESFCVDAKKFKKVLHVTRGNEINFDLNSETDQLAVTCECGTLILSCEKAEVYQLAEMDRWLNLKAEDFTPAGELVSLAKRVGFCTSRDEARPVLQGVCFGPDSISATDGFRVGYIERNPTGFEGIIPMAAVTAMRRLISGKAEYHKGINGFYIRDANVRIFSNLIDGHFPDYKAIIPRSHKITARFSAKYLREALRFARLVYSNATAKSVHLEISESEVMIKSEDYDFGETKTVIQAAVEFDKTDWGIVHQPFIIGFNGDMLLDYTHNARGEEISVDLLANNAPAVFSADSDELKFVVMPVHLG